jgi:hypothetical protein
MQAFRFLQLRAVVEQLVEAVILLVPWLLGQRVVVGSGDHSGTSHFRFHH